jgi:hypothetical protein
MEATNDFTIQTEKKRPDFLTVICILSFIGCGLVFLTSVTKLFQNSPEHTEKSIEQLREFNPAMADKMEENMLALQDNMYVQVEPYLSFVYLLLSFLGVLMMWKGNRKGFYFYLAGELLPYVGMLFMGKETMSMMGAMGGSFVQTLGVVMMVLVLVFDFAFILMYGLNLKYLKK